MTEINKDRFAGLNVGTYILVFEKDYNGIKQKAAKVVELINAEDLPAIRIAMIADGTSYGQSRVTEKVVDVTAKEFKFAPSTKEGCEAFASFADIPTVIQKDIDTAKAAVAKHERELELYNKHFSE